MGRRAYLADVDTITPDGETITSPAPTDVGDHDKFAHYVRKNQITESAVTGKAVRALCGKKWVPSRKPDDFPVCLLYTSPSPRDS